jgi:hypothetical protein
MSNKELKTFESKLVELPEDSRNLILQYGEELYQEYKKNRFKLDNIPKISIHDLFKFSDMGSIHVILNDSHEEYKQIVDQVNNKEFTEWVHAIDECYKDGIETPKQQIERVENYYGLACEGCNVVIRTNSYFVLKMLYLYGLNKEPSVYLIDKSENETWKIQDFEYGMPDNFITDTCVNLYREELNL